MRGGHARIFDCIRNKKAKREIKEHLTNVKVSQKVRYFKVFPHFYVDLDSRLCYNETQPYG